MTVLTRRGFKLMPVKEREVLRYAGGGRDTSALKLIEEVNKSVRRKKKVDEGYLDQLFQDVTALYRLDQIAVDGTKRILLGELPTASAVLLGSLALAWVGIGGYALSGAIKRKRIKKD